MRTTTFSILLLAALTLFQGCQANQSNSGTPSTGVSGPGFFFSKAGMVVPGSNPDNWCAANFPEAVLINADPSGPDHKYFMMGGGVYKVVVEYGNAVASILLRKNSAGAVEIFTGAQFPQCLSRQEYGKLDARNPIELQYNNGHNIHFDAVLQQDGGNTRIVLKLPADTQYGLSVRRCATCN